MERRLLVALALAVFAAGCAGDDASDTAVDDTEVGETDEATDDATEADEDAGETEVAGEALESDDVTVALASTDLGDVLVDDEGMTLYMFDPDEQGRSVCEDDCADNWPPLVTDGEPTAGDGVDAALLGTAERPDGTMQITYGGWPLYGFIGDQAPGDVAGQSVQDVWWVLDASGTPLRDLSDADDEEARPSY